MSWLQFVIVALMARFIQYHLAAMILYDSAANSQQSIAPKKSSDSKIEYIMASMLIVLLDVW